MSVPRQPGQGSGGETPREIVPFQLKPRLREALEVRVAELVRSAWSVSDLAGLRHASWVRHQNREVILRQRIAALSDSELLELWDGWLPASEQTQEPSEVELRAEIYSHRRIQLHVPGYLVGRR